MEIYKKNSWAIYTYNSQGKAYDLLNLKFYTLFQLFSSHYLKVDSENLVLGFLYHYTRLQAAR